MRTKIFGSISVDYAVDEILGLFARGSRDTRVIYFDGWDGFGASTVLRAMADKLKNRRTSVELQIDKVIHIDCSSWKNRRAMQRAIAVELELDYSVMVAFDIGDEEDDFNGVDEGSRNEILSVAEKIFQALKDQRFIMIFHNGSDKEIDMSRSGVPSFLSNLMLWTFRTRFQSTKDYYGIQKKVTNADRFVSKSFYDIAIEDFLSRILHREAAAIATNNSCMQEINTETIVRCCIYGLFLQLSFPKSTEFDWEARASNYLTCNCIIQADRAWEISYAFGEEIKWDLLHPISLKDVRAMFVNEFSSEDGSIHFLTFQDKLSFGGQQHPWIFVTSRSRNQQAHNMLTINTEASSYFLAHENPGASPLVLEDCLFNHSNNLHVLHLSYCAFKFASPPFTCCRNMRFLGLDHCEDYKPGEEVLDQKKWVFLHSLWVLDIFYTDWCQILSKEATDLMINLWELNVEGTKCSYTNILRSRLPKMHKLRIIKPSCVSEALATHNENSFGDETELHVHDLLGNEGMEILPRSLSYESNLEVLILQGFSEIENVDQQKCRKASKLIKISLEGCKRLETLFLHGLQNLVELDLSGSAIKVLDFNTMVVKTPSLQRVFLLGCERLRSIKWNIDGFKIQPNLMLLCIDTRGGIGRARPSIDLNKPNKMQVHAILADARLARSLSRLIKYCEENHGFGYVYFNICITSSAMHSGVIQPEATSKQTTASNDLVNLQQLGPAIQYKDVITMVGDVPIHAFPQPPAADLSRHIEIAGESCNVEGELVTDSPNPSLGYVIRSAAEYLHVHDAPTMASLSEGDWLSNLRRCRVERCPKLKIVFPPDSYSFDALETFWASDLLMARSIWSEHAYSFLPNLKHLHLRRCPSLQFVLPVDDSLFYFYRLKTLHIVHCGELKHLFIWNKEQEDIYHEYIAFPKLTAIHLHDLPMLQQICDFKMVAPALQSIRIRGCFNLRRLPAVRARGEGKRKPAVEIEKDVWDALEWDDDVQAGHFEVSVHSSRYYRKKLPRGSLLR